MRNSYKVLLIGREEECKLLKLIIKRGLRSAEVEMAINAVIGLRKAAAEVYDIIFVSVELPRFNGCVVVEAIRKIKSCENMKIIAITSSTHIPRDEFLKRGFDKVIIKPFRASEIIEAIRANK